MDIPFERPQLNPCTTKGCKVTPVLLEITFGKTIYNKPCILSAFSDFKTVFCAVCSTFNIWCFCPLTFFSLPRDKHSVTSSAVPVIWDCHLTCLHLIDTWSHFKSHLETSSLLSRSSWTALLALTFISTQFVQSQNSVDTPGQRSIASDENRRVFHPPQGKRLPKF